MRCRTWDRDKNTVDEFTAHYIADGSLFRFELHAMDDRDTSKDHSDDPQMKAGFLYFREADDVRFYREQPEKLESRYTYFFDGKWERPDDLVLCPRLYERLVIPLEKYWHDQYYGLEDIRREVKNVGC